jgi:Tat protein secretion system quality control protein TatD with DNase activity
MLIDTHTHLDDARYESDREAMIARAREAGVESMITIGCDLATQPIGGRARRPVPLRLCLNRGSSPRSQTRGGQLVR